MAGEPRLSEDTLKSMPHETLKAYRDSLALQIANLATFLAQANTELKARNSVPDQN